MIHELNVPLDFHMDVRYDLMESQVEHTEGDSPMHIHDKLEIYIQLEGDASFMVENNLYKLKPMDILITKPNEIHNPILNSDTRHRHACFWFDPSCDFLFSAFLAHGFGEGNLCTPRTADAEKIREICSALEKAAAQKDKKRELCLCFELLYRVERNLGFESQAEVLPTLLREILCDIQENLCHIHTLGYFEGKYFVSNSTLHRLFYKYMRVSPKVYLESKRLAYSRILLEQGMSVGEACETAGFSDYSNYIRVFRTRFDMTPLRYRNMKRQGSEK
jgi:AraC-like DNA-binding protein